eukprot:SAG11_NODE_4758_length_1778_cov_1.365694_2_plen_184_part_00
MWLCRRHPPRRQGAVRARSARCAADLHGAVNVMRILVNFWRYRCFETQQTTHLPTRLMNANSAKAIQIMTEMVTARNPGKSVGSFWCASRLIPPPIVAHSHLSFALSSANVAHSYLSFALSSSAIVARSLGAAMGWQLRALRRLAARAVGHLGPLFRPQITGSRLNGLKTTLIMAIMIPRQPM